MTDKKELAINLLLVDRLTCRNEIEKKLKDVLTINSIFLGGIIGAFAYAIDKNINMLFIVLPLFIFSWVWMIYSDLNYFYINSKLICKIEDEINAILGQAIMKRENFFGEYNKKHFYYNFTIQFFTMVPILLIYGYSIHRTAIYLSERDPSMKYWIYLVGFLGIILILLSIRHIYSTLDDDSKLLEEFINKRKQKYSTLQKILDNSDEDECKYRKP